MSAFEEETLDLNITSKYDNLSLEDETETKQPEESSAVSVESIPEPAVDHVAVMETAPAEHQVEEVKHTEETVPEPAEEHVAESAVDVHAVEHVVHESIVVKEEAIPEPGQESLQMNGHVEEKVAVAEQNGHLVSEVIEPAQSHFSSESTEPAAIVEKVAHLHVHEEERTELPEPGLTSFSSITATTEEEEAEGEDVVTPIPMSRAKATKLSEDEELDQIAEDMNFKKVGLSKSWWNSKRTETEETTEKAPPKDKFKTIKQNIRKGNTRSLLERFENMSNIWITCPPA